MRIFSHTVNRIHQEYSESMDKRRHPPFLKGDKIFLRAFAPGDEEVVARIENHPDPRSTLFYALPTSLEQQREKINSLLADHHCILFTICRNKDGEPIGQTSFVRIDWVGGMAIFYIGIADKDNWGKGYGKEATSLMLAYAFETLNLNRIQLHVAVENEAAVHVYKKTGFVIEGTLREAMYHEGRYCDFFVMGILRNEWLRRPRGDKK
jgi:RimJ/RimL family protein N-acetyltransferase